MRHDWIVQLTGVVLQKKAGYAEVIKQVTRKAKLTPKNDTKNATLALYRVVCVAMCINGSFQGVYASRVIRTAYGSVRRPKGGHVALTSNRLSRLRIKSL